MSSRRYAIEVSGGLLWIVDTYTARRTVGVSGVEYARVGVYPPSERDIACARVDDLNDDEAASRRLAS